MKKIIEFILSLFFKQKKANKNIVVVKEKKVNTVSYIKPTIPALAYKGFSGALTNPVFIPPKHTILSYANQQRQKRKRINKKLHNQ